MNKNTDNMYTTFKKAIKEKPLKTDFPILDEMLNGFWSELYVFSSGSGMGKTSMLSHLLWSMVEKNRNTEALFFSFDQPANDISIKIASQSTEIPFSYLKNLKKDNIRYERKLKRKLQKLKKLYQKITILDTRNFRELDIETIEDFVNKKREQNPGKKLVVAIDQLYSISEDNLSIKLERLKKLSHRENCTILVSMSLPGEPEIRRPVRKDLVNHSIVISKAYAFISLYTDFVLNFETPFLEWDWAYNNQMIPVSELIIFKNKIEAFTGNLFYRFYSDISKFRECVKPEIENYRQMVINLADYKKDKKMMIKKQENPENQD